LRDWDARLLSGMSARVLIHARHTAKDVSEAVARAWPDLVFTLYRDQKGDMEEALLSPGERLHEPSANTVTIEGSMTGREMSGAFKRAFGVAVEVSAAKTGSARMDVALDRAR
jgi:hypothetical protein